MRKCLRFFQQIKRLDFIFIALLIILAVYPWHQLPQLTIRPDGFSYLISSEQKLVFGPNLWVGIEGSAILWGIVLTKLFSVKMSLYFGLELIIMLCLNTMFYAMVRIITKKPLVAFVAALLFSVNYIGLWDMHSAHCYCWFMERPINMLLLMPSFTLLHLFLEKRNKNYYFISLFLYFIGVGSAHFLFLFTGPFFFYPIFWYLFNEKKIIPKLRGFIMGLPYLILTMLFLFGQDTIQKGMAGNIELKEFLFHPEKYHYLYNSLIGIVNWTQFPALVISAYNNPYINILSISQDAGSLVWFIPYAVVAYIVAIAVVYLKLPKFRALMFTCLSGAFSAIALSIYSTSHFDPTRFGSTRYLYLPTYLLIIFWTIFMWTLCKISKKFIPLIIGIVIYYYLTNVTLIQKSFDISLVENSSTKMIFAYIQSLTPRLEKNSLVVAPYPEMGSTEATFFTEQLGKGKFTVMSEFNGVNPVTWQNIASKSSSVIRLRYDKNRDSIVEEKIK